MRITLTLTVTLLLTVASACGQDCNDQAVTRDCAGPAQPAETPDREHFPAPLEKSES